MRKYRILKTEKFVSNENITNVYLIQYSNEFLWWTWWSYHTTPYYKINVYLDENPKTEFNSLKEAENFVKNLKLDNKYYQIVYNSKSKVIEKEY